jgi:hypothetical protein
LRYGELLKLDSALTALFGSFLFGTAEMNR